MNVLEGKLVAGKGKFAIVAARFNEFIVSKLIAGAGGVAVLAHPMELKMGEMTLESLVHEWHGQGLAGIEVYHPSAANNSLPFLLHLAEREGMLVTGGSDFHGPQVRQSCIGEGLDRWTTAEADVQKLLNRIGL